MILRAAVWVWDAASGRCITKAIATRDVPTPEAFRALVTTELQHAYPLGEVIIDIGVIGRPWSHQ